MIFEIRFKLIIVHRLSPQTNRAPKFFNNLLITKLQDFTPFCPKIRNEQTNSDS